MKPQSFEGGCLCGAIRYRVTGDALARTLCHCRSCRRACGAPTLAWAVFAIENFALLQGQPKIFASSPGVQRTFCSDCGTPLTYARAWSPAKIDITTASLDDADAFAPVCEIWVEQKLAWEALNPALAQYPRSSRPDANPG